MTVGVLFSDVISVWLLLLSGWELLKIVNISVVLRSCRWVSLIFISLISLVALWTLVALVR